MSFVRPSAGLIACAVALACNLPRQMSSTGSTADDSSGTSTGGTSGSTSSPTSTSGTPTTSTTTTGSVDLGGGSGQCSLFEQDCPKDQKCTAWNEDGGIFPNGTRCVPVDPNPAMPGEECFTEGGFGTGLDTCAKGSFCLDIENDGMATCVAYCTGSMDDPVCPDPSNQRCSFLFEPTVPLCFNRCDPLIQDCGMAETCVPNIAAIGAPYFVCMPRVFPDLPGGYGDSCYALSHCDPGNLCIFAENVPGCKTVYCCSVWCDLTGPNTCTQFDPTLTCVPWYEPGQETPGFENVGICGIMQ